MRQYVWALAVLCCLAVVDVEGRSLVKRQVEVHKDTHVVYGDKRKVEAAFGIKNAILGFVFNKLSGFAWETRTTPKTPTTTEDIVIFNKDEKVSLQVPDQLFGSSFQLVTNVSTTVGDLMINSALRLQRLLESMRPFLRFVFGAKGVVIEATTDKPIFSEANSI